MKTEEIRVETPLATAGVVLIPLARTSLDHMDLRGRLVFMATREPVAIVVVSPQGKQAFRITGEEVAVDQLTEEVPGLKDRLAEQE